MAIIWALGEEAFRHTDLVIPQPKPEMEGWACNFSQSQPQ